MQKLTFTIFSDFHYKKGMYASTVTHMNEITRRAKDSGSEFLIHCGDFCNDYIRSPELTRAYRENPYGIPALGIYGNHELESMENSMAAVTPLLCGTDVIWGTEDGKIGDGSVAYYHRDFGKFRVIGLDSNYSLSADGEWQHNTTCSYGPPRGNKPYNCLGPVQFAWLEHLLTDAAEKGLHCMLFSHACYCTLWHHDSDTEAMQALIAKYNALRPGTVIAAINGHYHTNHIAVIENVLYFDVNTTINGEWIPEKIPHYTEEHTFEYTDYDEAGNAVRTYQRPYTELWMAPNTWFFKDPLSAVITVSEDGTFEIVGSKTEWHYGILPPVKPGAFGFDPCISDFSGKVF